MQIKKGFQNKINKTYHLKKYTNFTFHASNMCQRF